MPPPSATTLLDLITAVDNVPLDFEHNHAPYYRLFLSPDDPRPHGYIHPDTVANLAWPASFLVNHDTRSVTITAPPSPPSSDVTGSSSSSNDDDASKKASSVKHINDALQQAVNAAIAAPHIFHAINGRHSEPFRILGARNGLVHVERFAATLFGIATRGAHMTGYTRQRQQQDQDKPSSSNPITGIWVARRSPSLFTYPNKLDSTVAGGVKATDSPTACILAEAAEEASLPESLSRSSSCSAVGVLTLANRNPRTNLFHSDVLYVYDLEMPIDVIPTPGDDEVAEFVLMPVAEVRQRMENGEFKPNVCPVMIDFMMRHGFITPESEGEGLYVEISNRLRRRLPVPTSSDI